MAMAEIEAKKLGRRRRWSDDEVQEAIALLKSEAPEFWDALCKTLREGRDRDTLGPQWALFARVLSARFSDDEFIGGLNSLIWQYGGVRDILGVNPPRNDGRVDERDVISFNLWWSVVKKWPVGNRLLSAQWVTRREVL